MGMSYLHQDALLRSRIGRILEVIKTSVSQPVCHSTVSVIALAIV